MIDDLVHPTAWLTAGGDDRLALDPVTGLNRYGRGPLPVPGLLAFGSATASTISSGAFEAANALRNELQLASQRLEAKALYTLCETTLAGSLRDSLGLPDVSIHFCPSGTDIHSDVQKALVGKSPASLLTLVTPSNETGSGIRSALDSPLVTSVDAFRALEGGNATYEFHLRERHGGIRADSAIEAELSALLDAAHDKAWACLLVVTDVSKTGLIGPCLATVMNLKARWPRLTILIDACQWRLSAEAICAYIAHGFMVAITGSKFMAGPSFSGALIVPPHLSRLSFSPTLSSQCNWGLLLRWAAALHELSRFQNLLTREVSEVCRKFAKTINARLARDSNFMPMEVAPLNRQALFGSLQAEPEYQTIFPFWLTPDRVPLDRADVHVAYDRLCRPRLGQAVHLGQAVCLDGGPPVLRLCLSAPLIVEACQSETGLRTLIDDALHTLDLTSLAAMEVSVKKPRRRVS